MAEDIGRLPVPTALHCYNRGRYNCSWREARPLSDCLACRHLRAVTQSMSIALNCTRHSLVHAMQYSMVHAKTVGTAAELLSTSVVAPVTYMCFEIERYCCSSLSWQPPLASVVLRVAGTTLSPLSPRPHPSRTPRPRMSGIICAARVHQRQQLQSAVCDAGCT
jgi:hypothetical protein